MIINKKRLNKTLIDLVKISAPSKHERPVAIYLKKYFRKLGYKLEEDNAGRKICGNSGNLYLKIPGETKSPSVAFLCHLDTIVPTVGLKPVITKRKIRSDGKTILGADDRAGIALLCELIHFVQENDIIHRPIEIVFTVSEEIGLLGIKEFNCKKIKSKLAYVLDTSGPAGNIVVKAPGRKILEVKVLGREAHAGIEPEKGINAIAIAASAVNSIRHGRIDKETTLNIGEISGGIATNVVASKVIVKAEVRSFKEGKILTQFKKIKHSFTKMAKKYGGRVKFIEEESFIPFTVDKSSKIVKLAVDSAKKLNLSHKILHSGGGSDANVLNKRNIPSIGLGIGYFNAHSKDEYILLRDYYKGLKWLIQIVKP